MKEILHKFFLLIRNGICSIVPWMACSDDECAKLTEQLEKDLHSGELKRLSLISGGKEVDKRIVAVLRNASKLGFMDMMWTKDV